MSQRPWLMLFLFGFVCLALSFWVSEGRYVALPLVGLIGVGVRIAERSRRRREVLAVEPERFGPSKGRQVVGRACAACKRRFVVEEEAEACAKCGVLVHEKCGAVHAEDAHGRAEPYR